MQRGGQTAMALRRRPRRALRLVLPLFLTVAAATAAAANNLDPLTDPAGGFGTRLDALRTTSAATILDAEALGGVQHFSLPLSQGSCPPAALHGFAKCLVDARGNQHWRLIVAWARVQLTRLQNVAEDLSAFGPYPPCDPAKLYLEPTGGSAAAAAAGRFTGERERREHKEQEGRRVELTVHEPGGIAFMPRALVAVVPAAQAAAAYAVRVEGSDYLAILDATDGCFEPADPRSLPEPPSPPPAAAAGANGTTAAAASPQQQPARRLAPPRLPGANLVVVSTPPGYKEDLAGEKAYLRRLREHLAWHSALGFDGAVLYLDRAQAARLLRLPGFRALLADYRVGVVRSAYFPKISWLPWGAQGLGISHALLALWGHDVGLLPVDVDEFLLLEDTAAHPAAAALPPLSTGAPSTQQSPSQEQQQELPRAALAALVGHCGGGAGVISFERYALFCGRHRCASSDESALWLPGDDGFGGGGGGSDNSSGSSSSSSAWAHRSARSPLADYNLIEAVPHPGDKVWATPACAFPSSVHEARLSGLPGCAAVQARPACGRVVHLINAFHARAGRDDGWRRLANFSHPWWPAAVERRAALGALGEGRGAQF